MAAKEDYDSREARLDHRRKKRKRNLVGGLCAGLLLLALSPAFAAEPRWLPLSEATNKYGLSDAAVDMILDGGGQVSCRRNKQTVYLVGWTVTDWPGTVLTNAHTLYERAGPPRTDFTKCRYLTNRQVRDGTSFEAFNLSADPADFLVGEDIPFVSEDVGPGMELTFRGGDRLLWPLMGKSTDIVPFAIDSGAVASVRKGDRFFMVSAGKTFHPDKLDGFEPMIQQCEMKGIRATPQKSHPGQPDLLLSDCESQNGTSGSMLFVRERDAGGTLTGRLLPIAVHSGKLQADGTSSDWVWSRAAMLDSNFMETWTVPMRVVSP